MSFTFSAHWFSLCDLLWPKKPTIGTVVIHQYYFLQKVFRGTVDDASQGSFDDGQGLVQVDQHNAQAW